MEREACVCVHGFERSDSCAEIIIINSELSCHIYHQIHCHPSVFLHLLAERDL